MLCLTMELNIVLTLMVGNLQHKFFTGPKTGNFFLILYTTIHHCTCESYHKGIIGWSIDGKILCLRSSYLSRFYNNQQQQNNPFTFSHMKQIIGESKSWSSALPDLSVARQLHSSDFVAKFLPSSCERYPKIGCMLQAIGESKRR